MRRLDDTSTLTDRAFEVFDAYRRARSRPWMDAEDREVLEREAMEAVVVALREQQEPGC